MKHGDDLSIAGELRSRGIHLTKRFGQNFMVDRNMLDVVVREGGLRATDVVLEVGTGAGFLSQRLAGACSRLVTVEIDRGLYEVAAGRLAGYGNVTLLHRDALEGGHRWSRGLREALGEALEAHGGASLKLVANLPYGIATAVVRAVLEGGLEFQSCCFTCQREVAQRLAAVPGTREYGYISVVVALLAEVRIVRVLPPSVFWPRPKVDSAIVTLTPDAAKRALAGDIGRLSGGISLLFRHRRRQVTGVVRRLGLDEDDILKVRQILAERGLEPQERVFNLAPAVIREIAMAVLP